MTKSRIFQIIISGLVVIAVLIAVFFKYGWIIPPEKDSTLIVTPVDACVNKGEKQQFTASVDEVVWSVVSLTPDPSIGNIDQDGLFTANGSASFGKITASKDDLLGYAIIMVVPEGQVCNTTLNSSEAPGVTVKLGDKSDEGEVVGQEDKSFGTSVPGVWSAHFVITLEYEVNNGFEEVGLVEYNIDGGFFFTVDYATEKLKLKKPSGSVTINVSDDIASCETTVINDPFIFVEATDGKLVDTDFVFGNKFIIPDHYEGIKMSCLNSDFSDPNASVIDLIGQYAFPVTVEAADKATAPIQGSFSFANGRQATINGTVTIYRVDL